MLWLGGADLLAQPVNDNFTNRIHLVGDTITLPVSNVGATAETDEPNSNYTWLRPSIWYSWTAPAVGTAFAYNTGDNYVRYIAIFTGDKLKSLRQVDTPNGGFETKAGQTYQIQVMAPTTTPDYVFHLDFYLRPSNDAFTNRILLDGVTVTTNGNTLSASRESGEPRHNLLKYGRSVWFSWMAPASGWLFVNLTNSPNMVCEPYTGDVLRRLQSVNGVLLNANPFTGVMAVEASTEYSLAVDGRHYYDKVVYSGPFTLNLEFSGLTLFSPLHNSTFIEPAQISLLATNTVPDIDGEISQLDYFALNLVSQQEVWVGTGSGPLFNAVWNKPGAGYYQIQARGTNTMGRTIRSNPSIIIIRPGNDEFANRFNASGSDAIWSVNFDAATRVSNDPKVAKILGDDFDGTTLWWMWTAPHDGTVSLECDNWTIALAVYSGKPGAFTTILQPCWSSGQFQVQAGKTYQILCSDRYPTWAPSQGNVHLHLEN